MGGISIWQLLIIAVIVVLLFGTKKLRNIGGDLGGAVRDFKKPSIPMSNRLNHNNQHSLITRPMLTLTRKLPISARALSQPTRARATRITKSRCKPCLISVSGSWY